MKIATTPNNNRTRVELVKTRFLAQIICANEIAFNAQTILTDDPSSKSTYNEIIDQSMAIVQIARANCRAHVDKGTVDRWEKEGFKMARKLYAESMKGLSTGENNGKL